jgi:1L-myo-inositol 1-phosphate cytidylyltransferase
LLCSNESAMIRNAVILAAGKGTRLRQSDDDLPKPLHRVGGVPLIKRTILALAEGGVSRVVVVTGFMAALIQETLNADRDFDAAGVQIEFVHNAEFEKSNGISVITGGRRLDGPFLLSMADHIYASSVVALLASQDLTVADLYLATDPRIGDVLDVDDATKVRTENGRIVEISKTLSTYDRIDCGVFCVGQRLVEVLEQVRSERGDCSLSNGVQRLAELGRARVADIGNAWWQDVDTPADREHAEKRLGADVRER